MTKYIGPLTWSWLIIVGGLMMTPGGMTCIKCGPLLTQIISVISISIGIVAFVANQRAINR